jgi:hypothetical protein
LAWAGNYHLDCFGRAAGWEHYWPPVFGLVFVAVVVGAIVALGAEEFVNETTSET